MEQKELQEFLYFFTHNKSLTRAQQFKRDALLARDFFSQKDGIKNRKDDKDNSDNNKVFKALSALDTAYFLALFNEPMGLKYLTHDFDPISDGRPQSLENLHTQVKELLNKKDLNIPSSLWSPINRYLEGGKKWCDTFGVEHSSYIVDPKWKEWCLQNKMHPINNPNFANEILSFRSTIRLVSPLLKDICDRAKKGLMINVKEVKLEKADFYTNTYILYMVMKRILSMMNRRASKNPDVVVSYKRTTDAHGRMLRQIILTQFGSYADTSLDDLKNRLTNDPEAGDFGSIRNSLNGYCLWQVESLWEGQPFRWNLLKTEEMPETEEISKDSVAGFTHILTYYIV